MCGIWASIGNGKSSDLRSALSGIDAARTRGPDGQQLIEISTPSGPLFLGHRRLSVYDLSTIAAQPMQRGPLTIVFNGALYDFQDFRAEFARDGAIFETQGDTEVLLEAWLRWGPACLARFDGMFAAIVYDARTQILHLVRDRYGEKPLHILKQPDCFAVASEINQFLESVRIS
jgi:asparagine synthase (glutamine-hydrolysing)